MAKVRPQNGQLWKTKRACATVTPKVFCFKHGTRRPNRRPGFRYLCNFTSCVPDARCPPCVPVARIPLVPLVPLMPLVSQVCPPCRARLVPWPPKEPRISGVHGVQRVPGVPVPSVHRDNETSVLTCLLPSFHCPLRAPPQVPLALPVPLPTSLFAGALLRVIGKRQPCSGCTRSKWNHLEPPQRAGVSRKRLENARKRQETPAPLNSGQYTQLNEKRFENL